MVCTQLIMEDTKKTQVAALTTGKTGATPAPAPLVTEDKPDVNATSRALNLKFPVRTLPAPSSKHHLVRAVGARIDCYNSRMIPLQFQRQRYTWAFEIAEVKKPILRSDFLIAQR